MGQMLKRIEPSINEEEVQSVFEQFDYNKDGTISFNEF
jgi:Ca2+-binding EF-hand superfamily protein